MLKRFVALSLVLSLLNVLVGKAAVVPVNLNPPPKRLTDEQA